MDSDTLWPQLANHVAAVAVFRQSAGTIPGGGSLTAMSGLRRKNDRPNALPTTHVLRTRRKQFLAHLAYVQNGMVEQAADFVASRLT